MVMIPSFELPSGAKSTEPLQRAYSLANTPQEPLRLTVGLAGVPPHLGKGSSYLFSLRAGDTLQFHGPYGDFHVHPSAPLVFLGAGTGMAPLRSQILTLLPQKRSMTYWHSARTAADRYYYEEMTALAVQHPHFHYHSLLTEEGKRLHEVYQPKWDGLTHYYLCGPSAMITNMQALLLTHGIPSSHIHIDDFG
jgi:Na+-transporting NADH:ubiquinone oxidoreductase subunit F